MGWTRLGQFATSLALIVGLVLASVSRATDFATQVVPVLTRHGCNAGACHGAAAGRGGFRLSLLGSNPVADYEAIVHGFEGRRVHRTDPRQSLLLRKPGGDLAHGGDVALPEDSLGYRLIHDWLSEDVPRPTERTLTDFRVSPSQLTLKHHETSFQLKCEARFDHGTWEDVTRLVLFTVEDEQSIELDVDSACGKIKRPGQHVLLARFLHRVQPILLRRAFEESPLSFSQSHAPNNFIDQEIDSVLAELAISTGNPIDDLTFLRRATLDLTGRLPTPEDITNFQAWPSVDRRSRLVDRLLASKAFVDYWTLRYAKLLRLHALPNEPQALGAYGNWLRESVAAGRPWNEMVRELLLTTGDSHVHGPANFARMVSDPRAHAELVGDVMLGVRLGCANCHDHPLDKWTQDDYHGLATILARIDRGRHVQQLSRGEVTNPRTKQPAVPRIPGQRFISQNDQALTSLAEWIDSPSQSTLAQAHANRLWEAMFGQGLVESTDDLRETNPASHPKLLKRLADSLIDHQYDLRQTLRIFASSQAYARETTSSMDRFYARRQSKPLTSEVLADAIADVTDVPHSFQGYALGTRAIDLWDTRLPSEVLNILGRCTRSEACSSKSDNSRGLAAQLHLLNGDLINRRLVDPTGRLSRLVSAGVSNADIIDEFYQRTLGRPPSLAESTHWQQLLETRPGAERLMQLEDFVWSLLSSQDFQRNN